MRAISRSVGRLTAVILISCIASGCGGVTSSGLSPAAFKLARSSHVVARTKASDRLAEIATAVSEAESSGEISGREAALLHDVLATAEAGDWERASSESRRLMGDRR